MNSRSIRVLVVDDSAVVRGLLARALETDPEIEVVGTAMHGEAALAWMRKNSVDVVILDVEMPVMDGLKTLEVLHVEFPKVHVVMASALTQKGAETSVRAMALGAVACFAKPQGKSAGDSIAQLVSELVTQVKALGTARAVVTEQKPIESRPTALPPASRVPPQILVIGSSTGGPKALTTVLSALPQDFAVPTFIAQHMPPTFTPMLAKHLMADTNRPCKEAVHGDPILRGHTYVAPGDFHLEITKVNDRLVTHLNQQPPEHYCRPSVNPLFRSAAEWYGKSVLAVMLTGMGSDGLEGTRAIIERQGYVIAQDEESSVVWGMPGSIVSEQLAHQILPLSEVAWAIQRSCAMKVLQT